MVEVMTRGFDAQAQGNLPAAPAFVGEIGRAHV